MHKHMCRNKFKYVGRLRFSGSLCIRVPHNVMSIDLSREIFATISPLKRRTYSSKGQLFSRFSSSATTDVTLSLQRDRSALLR